MDQQAVREVTGALWAPLMAITSAHEGQRSGQIAVAASGASILPERPRVLVALWKANYTHELAQASGAFALHLLRPGQFDLVRRLGFRSGRDGDKLAGLALRAGVTGCPILLDTLAYVECHVVKTMDGGDMTTFLADVVDGARLHEGVPLTWPECRARLPPDWLAEYEANQEYQRTMARGYLNQK
jgi:flavin reductase (DIM6/NTAB) family NADH-FMN oxidoreductase RutF